PDSGMPIFGTAGESFASSRIYSGALEQSNVDLAEQFTEMITTQRAYEAAARTITVTDVMLAETNNLKR
ncbi:MAG: flagellar basal body rod C-terminal domain-containing protein, partial [Candidatus Kapaibacteriota bacterium]